MPAWEWQEIERGWWCAESGILALEVRDGWGEGQIGASVRAYRDGLCAGFWNHRCKSIEEARAFCEAFADSALLAFKLIEPVTEVRQSER